MPRGLFGPPKHSLPRPSSPVRCCEVAPAKPKESPAHLPARPLPLGTGAGNPAPSVLPGPADSAPSRSCHRNERFSWREGPGSSIVCQGAAVGARKRQSFAPRSRLETEINRSVSFLLLNFPALLRACSFPPLLLLLFNENTLKTQLLLPNQAAGHCSCRGPPCSGRAAVPAVALGSHSPFWGGFHPFGRFQWGGCSPRGGRPR